MLNFHHVGLLVENIKSSLLHYTELFGVQNISNVYEITSQKVKICFVKVGDDIYIELVEPIGEESVVYKLLKKRISYYHVGYKVSNILVEVKKLEKLNYKAMDFFNSEAFDGKRCVFLFNPDAHLIELIED